VDCAVDVIAELGFGAASIRKIAERVGVAMSVVLYHFGNKDELVSAIVERGYRTLLDSMVPAVEAEATAAGKVRAYIGNYMAYMEANRKLLLAVAEIGSNYRSSQGDRLDQLTLDPTIRADLAKVDLEMLLGGIRGGAKIGGVPVKSVAIALRGALDGSVAAIMHDPDFDATSYGDDLASLFTKMIGNRR
jgi:AcrR family transcriptional regulator